MQVRLSTATLRELLDVTAMAAGDASALSLRARDGLLSLEGGDGHVWASASAPAHIEGEGETALPARLLRSLVERLPGGDASLSLQDDVLVLQFEGGDARLAALDPMAVLPGPAVSQAEAIALPCADLATLIAQVAFAVAHDGLRPDLEAVLLTLKGGRLSAWATDTYRLASASISCQGPTLRALLHHRAAVVLQRLAQGRDGDAIIRVNGNALAVEMPGAAVACALLATTYPNLEEYLSHHSRDGVLVDREALRDALLRAEAVGGRTVSCRLSLSEGALEAAASAELGSCRTLLPVQGATRPLTVYVQARYLLQPLKVMKGDEVELLLTGPASPMVLSGAFDGLEVVHLVMPLIGAGEP